MSRKEKAAEKRTESYYDPYWNDGRIDGAEISCYTNQKELQKSKDT